MKIFMLFFLSLLSFSLLGASCDADLQNYPIIDPVDQSIFNVRAKVYRPSQISKKKIPAIFIIPPIVGETVLDRRMAKKFCKNGMATYILGLVKVLSPEQEIYDLNVHDNSYVRALAGVRAVLNDLTKDPELNGEFGVLGMSLGGMLAAYIAGREPLIRANVLVVAAGNVPGVLAYSDQESVKAQRLKRMEIFRTPNQNSYKELLETLIPNDPINFAQNIQPKSSYLFIATNDTTVPSKYQQELRKKIRDPIVYEMRNNHFNAIVKAGTIHAEKITRFFMHHLKNN